MKVKCQGCGSEYEMPNILPKGQKVIMKDCPNCKKMAEIKKSIQEMGL